MIFIFTILLQLRLANVMIPDIQLELNHFN